MASKKKKQKLRWFVPAVLEPTEMDLKIMEWEAKGHQHREWQEGVKIKSPSRANRVE